MGCELGEEYITRADSFFFLSFSTVKKPSESLEIEHDKFDLAIVLLGLLNLINDQYRTMEKVILLMD